MIIAYVTILAIAVVIGFVLALFIDSVMLAGIFGFLIGVVTTAFIVAWVED